jgi:hypothetical protein
LVGIIILSPAGGEGYNFLIYPPTHVKTQNTF